MAPCTHDLCQATRHPLDRLHGPLHHHPRPHPLHLDLSHLGPDHRPRVRPGAHRAAGEQDHQDVLHRQRQDQHQRPHQERRLRRDRRDDHAQLRAGPHRLASLHAGEPTGITDIVNIKSLPQCSF